MKSRAGLRSRRGGVMVQALVVLAGLVTLLASLVADQQATFQASQNRLHLRRAEVAAQSAVQRALAAIQTANPNVVTLQDEWAFLGERGTQAFELDNATFRLQIVDAGAFVNVNTASAEQLQLLALTQEQIDSLLDWRESGLQPRASGAKDSYYNALETPYNARRAPLATWSELLLIRGWTARDLFSTETGVISTGSSRTDADGNPLPLIALLGTDSSAPNLQADGQARINMNQPISVATLVRLGIPGNVAGQLAAGAPYPSFQALLQRPGINNTIAQRLLDAVTFGPQTRLPGKININTAPRAALETIPGMTPDIASALITQQQVGVRSLGELVRVPGVNVPVLAQIADYLTVGSDTWLVRAYGESGDIGVAVEAVVGLRNNRAQILRWSALPDVAVPAWWNWPDVPDTTVDAEGSL